MQPSRDVGIPLKSNSHKEQQIPNVAARSPTLPPPKSLESVMSLEPVFALLCFFPPFFQRERSVVCKRNTTAGPDCKTGGEMERAGLGRAVEIHPLASRGRTTPIAAFSVLLLPLKVERYSIQLLNIRSLEINCSLKPSKDLNFSLVIHKNQRLRYQENTTKKTACKSLKLFFEGNYCSEWFALLCFIFTESFPFGMLFPWIKSKGK